MISTPEACDILGLRHPSLYEARKAGKLHAYFLDSDDEVPAAGGGKGNIARWDYDEVVAYGATLNQPPPPPPRDEWIGRAKCRGIGPAELNRIFFPEDGNFKDASKMCFSCPVRLQCLQWATKAGISEGMFGGATPSKLARFGKAWRRWRRLPRLCGWCGEAFLPTEWERYCRQACGVAGEQAGGYDPKRKAVK